MWGIEMQTILSIPPNRTFESILTLLVMTTYRVCLIFTPRVPRRIDGYKQFAILLLKLSFSSRRWNWFPPPWLSNILCPDDCVDKIMLWIQWPRCHTYSNVRLNRAVDIVSHVEYSSHIELRFEGQNSGARFFNWKSINDLVALHISFSSVDKRERERERERERMTRATCLSQRLALTPRVKTIDSRHQFDLIAITCDRIFYSFFSQFALIRRRAYCAVGQKLYRPSKLLDSYLLFLLISVRRHLIALIITDWWVG